MSEADKIRQKYADNPPEGYTKEEICKMSDNDILDMDYFLNEDEGDIFPFIKF